MSAKPTVTTRSSTAVLSPEQAIEKYATAVNSQATAPNYIELGAAYYIAHRWDEAIRAFEKAVEMDPRQAYAHFYLGILYAATGQRDKADAALEKVLQVSTNQMLKEQAQSRIPNIKSIADLGANS